MKQRVLAGLSTVAVVATLSAGGIAHAAPADGRAAEWVSSIDSGGTSVFGTASRAVAVDDGRFLWSYPIRPFGDSSPSGGGQAWLSQRGVAGWTTKQVTPGPGGGPGVFSLYDATDSLNAMLFRREPDQTLGPDQTQWKVDSDLVYRNSNGTFRQILHLPVAQVEQHGGTTVLGLSGDGQTAVYDSAIAPPDLPGHDGIPQAYAWSATSGATTRLGIGSDGQPLSSCSTGIVRGANGISEDGGRVFFRSPAESGPPCDDGKSSLYVWDKAAGRAQLVARASVPIEFAGATPDGRTAYLATTEALDPAADTDSTGDLYEVRIAADGATTTTCASCGLTRAVPVGGRAMATSSDGKIVYLLTPTPGTPQLYAFDGSSTRLVDDSAWGLTSLPSTNFQLSDDGRTVAYRRRVGTNGTPDSLYSAALPETGAPDAPTCVSCRVGETDPVLALYDGLSELGTSPGRKSAGTLRSRPGSISADGKTITFLSNDAKTDDATRGSAQTFTNLYRWTAADGLGLVGRSAPSSTSLGIGPTGASIYFVSGEDLAPEMIRSSSYQWFAARVGGGFPAPPGPPTPCAPAEGCRDTSPPVFGTPDPNSSALAGTGNAAPRPQVAPPVLSLTRPASAALRKAARTGRLAVRVRLQQPDGTKRRVAVRAFGRLGRSSATTRVAASTRTVSQAGATVSLSLRLSARARKIIRQKGRLLMRLRASALAAETRSLSVTVRRK